MANLIIGLMACMLLPLLLVGCTGVKNPLPSKSGPHFEWILLKEDADGTVLSAKAAGDFVGATFGRYAYIDNS